MRRPVTARSRRSWGPALEAAFAGAPRGGSLEDWRRHAQSLLSRQACVAHRNGQISALYATAYLRRPHLFKWSGLAAIASHHVRVALRPLQLGAEPHEEIDLPKVLGRWQALRLHDVDVIRQINNDIFDDIFWAHLAYDGTRPGLDEIERVLDGTPSHAGFVEAFARLDHGRQLLASARNGGEEAVWRANRDLLRHEQRHIVQPAFERLTCGFARTFSLGATAGFEVRGLWRATTVLRSFYGYALVRPRPAGRRTLPLLTSFEERWAWMDGAIVPRFRRYETRAGRLARSLELIIHEAVERGVGTALPV